MIGELIRMNNNEVIKTKGLLTQEERDHVNKLKKNPKTTKLQIEDYLLKRDHIITL